MQRTSRWIIASLFAAGSGFAACGDGGTGATGSSSTASSSSSTASGTGGDHGGTGGATGSGGQGGQGGQGGSSECSGAKDCPAPESECLVAACLGGMCGLEPAPDGKLTSIQTNGDCKKNVCKGGAAATELDDIDVFNDSNGCTADVCSSGTPQNVSLMQGAPCNEDGGTVCSAAGVCVGCIDDGDCASGKCGQNSQCLPESCFDGMKSAGESDTDCGGPTCAPCADNEDCIAATDCQSGVCTASKCAVPSCADGVKNGSETDADCGGSCNANCGSGKGCAVDTDCVGGQCSGSTCLPTCMDVEKNGSETDVDCGGPACAKCEAGLKCVAGSDCDSGVCNGGSCAGPNCSDSIKNGTETDVDCGGSCPSKCGPGATCKINGDCVSASCEAATKMCASTCTDGFKGGTETDVDCGGADCEVCGIGKGCGAGSDCSTTVCTGMSCVALHGCDPETAMDLSGQGQVSITFAGQAYTPACIRISPGTKVTFSGNFAMHPLVGGTFIGGVEMPDATSPITPTSSGASKTFTMSDSGVFGYYCDFHSAAGMYGAIFVD